MFFLSVLSTERKNSASVVVKHVEFWTLLGVVVDSKKIGFYKRAKALRRGNRID
jgi:hypothetical protein